MKIATENALSSVTERLSKLASGNFVLPDRERNKMAETEELGDDLVAKAEDRRADLQQIHKQSQAFDRINAIVLSVSGEVQITSAAADKLLDRYFKGEWLDANRLPDLLNSWVQQQLRWPQIEVAVFRHCQHEAAGGNLKIYLICDFAAAQHILMCSEQPSEFSLVSHFQSILLQTGSANGLSKREAEVLALVAAKKTNLQIAQQLGIGIKTVKKHLEHIFHKLGAIDRDDAVSKALGAIDRELP
jgi:DNA-binding CsgD family transcriptional regulator